MACPPTATAPINCNHDTGQTLSNGLPDYQLGLLRLEARITKTYLTKNGYPSNLWDLIDYQKQNPNLLSDLWNIAFNPIFEALQGEYMHFNTDFELEQILKDKLKTITPSGRTSYTRAYNAMAFYRTLREKGFAQVHKETQDGFIAKSTFYHNIKVLTDCGISRSHLQNLHAQDNKVVPFVQLVKIDFAKQTPDDYIEPVSQYQNLFKVA